MSEFRRHNLNNFKLKSQDKAIKTLCANLERDRLLKEKRFSLELKLKTKQQNAVKFNAENVRVITDTYTRRGGGITKTFMNIYLKEIDQKFRLKKKVMARTSKLGKRICWTLKAVGMFLILLRNVRIRLARKKLDKFVRNFCYKWLDKRREEKK